MSDPTRLSEEERARAVLQEQAEEITRLERSIAQQYGDASLPLAQGEEAPVLKERLFSRRTLFGWAFATLLFVFIVRMVLPLVFETVKESVVTSMKESMGETPVVAPVTPTLPTPVTPAIPPTPPSGVAPVTSDKGQPATTAAPSKTGATVVRIHKVEVKKLP